MALSLMALCAGGCESALGLGDYSISGSDSGTEGTAGLPLPALPDSKKIHDCTRCVAEQCSKEVAVCRASRRCMDRLDCQKTCQDPACIARCTALPPSPDFDDYFGCAFNSGTSPCTAECQAGANWGCMGNYRWDEGGVDARYVDVSVGTNMGVFVGGRSIASCQDGTGVTAGDDGCGPFVDLSDYGTAHLAGEYLVGVGAERVNAFAVKGPAFVGNHRMYTRPVPPSGRLELSTILTISLVPLGITGDSGAPRTAISFAQFDCLGVGASGAKAELESKVPCGFLEDGGTTYCTGLAQCRPEFASSTGVIANVPFEKGIFVRSCSGGRTMSRQAVSTTPGWFTDVSLYPMDATELSRFGG